MASINREAQVAKRAVRRTIRLLHEAIARNDLDEVKSIVAENVDVDFHWKGQSALQLAVIKGFYEISAFLIKKGADVNKCNAESNTVLNLACFRGLSSIAELLLVSGADVNLPNEQGVTPLNCCCYKGFNDIARTLLRNQQCDLNRANNRGQNALMTCVRMSNAELAEELIEVGCELDIGDEDLKTPLIIAAEKGNAEITKLLVYAGCQLNFQDKTKSTALFYAVSNGHMPIVEELLNAGAQVNTVSNKGISPLLEAVMKEQKQIAKLLIRNRSDLNVCNHLKQTALHIAVRQAIHYFGSDSNGKDMVRDLVLAGCDVNLPDNEGWRPAYQSAFGGDIGITKFLLEHKANLTVKAKNGDTLLHGAVSGNRVEIVQMLIDAGCDVNVPNKNNELPLYLAVNFKSDIKMVKMLLDAGSKVDICESSCNTSAAMAAVMNGYPEALRLLLDAGCDCNSATSSGVAPLCAVIEKNWSNDILDMLLAHPEIEVNGTRSHVPLITAATHDNCATIEKLLTAGADINAMDEKGWNAMYVAAANESLKLVKLLVRWGFSLESAKQKQVPFPVQCCSEYSDEHPHMELNPLYVAIRYDQMKMLLILISAHYKVPYAELDLLHDLVFKTGYAQEARVNSRVQVALREIFHHTLNKPMMLQHICRGTIRKSLAQKPNLKVDKLPIPAKIKNFILMTDILD